MKSEKSVKRHQLVWGNKQTAKALKALSKVKVLGFEKHTQDIFDVTSMFILQPKPKSNTHCGWKKESQEREGNENQGLEMMSGSRKLAWKGQF